MDFSITIGRIEQDEKELNRDFNKHFKINIKEINNLQKVLTKSNIFTIILIHSGYSKDRDNEVIVNDYTRRTKLTEHYSELGFEIEEISMYESHITWRKG